MPKTKKREAQAAAPSQVEVKWRLEFGGKACTTLWAAQVVKQNRLSAKEKKKIKASVEAAFKGKSARRKALDKLLSKRCFKHTIEYAERSSCGKFQSEVVTSEVIFLPNNELYDIDAPNFKEGRQKWQHTNYFELKAEAGKPTTAAAAAATEGKPKDPHAQASKITAPPTTQEPTERDPRPMLIVHNDACTGHKTNESAGHQETEERISESLEHLKKKSEQHLTNVAFDDNFEMATKEQLE
jgi:hypothetical protein